MNCPYCGSSIGGYVEMGSEAYSRVANGCCPHCGRKLSGGYSVGFAETGHRANKTISEEEYARRSGSTGTYGILMIAGCLFAGVSFIVRVFPTRPWLAIIIGIVYIAISAFIALGLYLITPIAIPNFNSGRVEYREDAVQGSGAAILSLIIDLFIIFMMLCAGPAGRAFHGIALALCVLMLIAAVRAGRDK